MSGGFSLIKRILVGRAFSSDRLGTTRLPKRLALPTFASDALSSVAYAPDEILLTLSLAGIAAFTVSPWVALAVVCVMAVVILAYRKNVEAYPSGGGDYEVVHTNLGGTAGRVAASALLVDYVLTVAVSISQASRYASGAIDFLHGYETLLSIALIAILALANLRGTKESGRVLAVPVYLFMATIGVVLLAGAWQAFTGTLHAAPSAAFDVLPSSRYEQGITALGGAFLVLRAFSSGCAALTGVEAVGNGVPSFQRPKARNASLTLILLGTISATMIMGIIGLAAATGVRFVDDPATQLTLNGQAVGDSYRQLPVIGQIARAVFVETPFIFYLVSLVTGVVLYLAANTAFNGFPNLASVLAAEGYLPRQLRLRGDRLAYSNGILLLTGAAATLVVLTQANVTTLIQMYIVGVFVSFSLGQFGMIRHWGKRLAVETDHGRRVRYRLNRVINSAGFAVVTAVLVIVVLTKFIYGAWVAVLAMALLWLLMSAINRHYTGVRDELSVDLADEDRGLYPSRSHGLVLVSGMNKPALLAINFAAVNHHTTLEAVTVKTDIIDTDELAKRWGQAQIQLPLRIMYSPYREYAGPIVDYVRRISAGSPRDVVVVYVPEFVVRHPWEGVLHNQSMKRLKAELTHLPRVVIASVPWQLGGGEEA
ncbi:APC family permease [Dermabacteraceae bacterium TAE3-ERU27]|nr:APC family permease [Dermabacteraceae bacterium TAE3-ERU27]